MNLYIRNGWAGDIINPDKTQESVSVPSLSDVYCGNNSFANDAASANDATETIVSEWKKIENAFASADELPDFSYGQMVT